MQMLILLLLSPKQKVICMRKLTLSDSIFNVNIYMKVVKENSFILHLVQLTPIPAILA